MSQLVVISYPDFFKAEEVRLKLWKLQADYLVELEDAVVATKNKDGNVKLNQAINLPLSGAASGGFWGTLVGMMFLNPLLGVAIGATSGAIAGALTDIGINDPFMKNVSIREDGQVMRPLLPVEVKPVSASKSKFDYYKLGNAIAPEQIFRPVAEGGCDFVKK